MQMLYDTAEVHALDAYDYLQVRAHTEVAPVDLRGHRPGQLSAKMSVTRLEDFVIEDTTWSADSELVAHRTERMIRAGDPDCFRLFLSVRGGERMEQAGSQTVFGPLDIALFDMSRPCYCIHAVGTMQVVMLNVPRKWVPMNGLTAVRPIIGTAVPRNLSGRNLLARFLIELAGLATAAEPDSDLEYAQLLPELTVGLIRQWLGQPDGITSHTLQRLQRAHVRAFMRRNLGDADLNPERIAAEFHMSKRSLHKLFHNSGHTVMQLLKQLRLEECDRRLRNAALTAKLIKEISAECGYLQPDRFARDFKQRFRVPPRDTRR